MTGQEKSLEVLADVLPSQATRGFTALERDLIAALQHVIEAVDLNAKEIAPGVRAYLRGIAQRGIEATTLETTP